MQLTPNLVFNGIAETVLEHYRDALGGEIEIRRFAETPEAGSVPADWKNKVIYGSLRSPAGIINVMDAPPERGGAPGDNFILGVNTENEAQTDEVFAKLAAGGSVIMPLEKTFWSPRFGMLSDKFAIKWMVSFNGAGSRE
jgi:PhnB protein